MILKLTDEKIKSFLNVTYKIAVKIPNHSRTVEFLKKCKRMIRTSTNISQTNQFKNTQEVYKNLQWSDVFLDGEVTSDREYTITKFENDKLKIHGQAVLTHKKVLKIL